MSAARKRRTLPTGSLSSLPSDDSKRWKSKETADKSAAEMEVESQIEQESKIRDGALRLYQAATNTKQSMEASKSLMTSNARLLVLMSCLQKAKKEALLDMAAKKRENAEKEPCKAKVTISDIRIPLEVKDVKEQMKSSHKSGM